MPPAFGESERIMNSPTRLRFGVMCRSLVFPEWQARCLRELLAMGNVEPVLMIVDGRPAPPESSAWKKLWTLLRFRVNLFSIYNQYVVSRRSMATKPVNVTNDFSGVPRISCAVVRNGRFSEYFTEQDLETIRGYDLDFILRFGFNIIRGDILTVPRYGVWSYHHGDEQKYRGAPPCFWEIYDGQPETGCILQRLTERLDGGIVLRKGRFQTIRHSYPRNRDAAHFIGIPWPAQVCAEILAGRAAYLQDPPTTTRAPIYLAPTNRQMIVFGLKQIGNYAAYLFRIILGRRRWAEARALKGHETS
jgi:hypothetical protein